MSNNSPVRQTPQDHCFFDTAKRERTSNASITQHGFDCPTQPVASRLTNRSHAGRLQRHPPAFDACRCSNTTTEAHLRSTLQITRVDSNSNSHARRHFMQCISRNHHKNPTPGRHPLLCDPFGDLRDSQTRNGTHQPFTIIHNNTISIELNTSAPSHSYTPFALPTIVFFNLAPSSNTSGAKYIQRVTH